MVREYIQHHPDATSDPVSSTLVHPDGRVARWPSNITNIVEPSPRRVNRPGDDSDPRSRLTQTPPTATRVDTSTHQVSDSDSISANLARS